MLGRFFRTGGIDLVDLGDLRAFMLVNDNLYKVCVNEQSRRYSVAKHFADRLRALRNSLLAWRFRSRGPSGIH